MISELQNDTYHVIITTEPFSDSGIISYPYMEEHLYVVLPPAHPLSAHKELSLHALNGQSIFPLSKIGFWYEVCKKNMPDSLSLVQEKMTMLNELRKSSALPFFATDITASVDKPENRIYIPLTNPDVNAAYNCNLKSANKKQLKRFISALETI